MPVVVLAALEQHLDVVADLDGRFAARLANSADGDLTFGLVADVDDGVVLGHLDDGTVDDLALLEEAFAAAFLQRGFEHRGEILVAAFESDVWVEVLLHRVGESYRCFTATPGFRVSGPRDAETDADETLMWGVTRGRRCSVSQPT